MAGIGFRLERLAKGGTYLEVITAHIYSALIVAGPWLFSTATIFLLNLFRPTNLSLYDNLYFRTAVTYVFAYSLVTTGGLFMPLSRYLADRLYAKDREAVVPALTSASLFVLVVQLVISALFYLFADGNPITKLLIVYCYLTVSLIWVLSAFLTALRDFAAIGWAFFIGGILAIGVCTLLGRRFELVGYLFGYFLGLLVLLSILVSRVFIEFRSIRTIDLSMLKALQYWPLVLAGGFFMAGTWIDKLILWWSPLSEPITNFFRINPDYDSAAFFATMTIIPALSLFLIYVETDFYSRYKSYYQVVLSRGLWTQILDAKELMVVSLRGSLAQLIRTQAIFTLLVITFAPKIVELLNLREPTIPILRIMTLGAFCHSLFLVLFTIIAYFDYTRVCMLLGLLFLVTNALFTLITVVWMPALLGYGYFCSTFICLAASYGALNWGLAQLEYYTFAGQKISTQES